jgi:hypothetical protein
MPFINEDFTGNTLIRIPESAWRPDDLGNARGARSLDNAKHEPAPSLPTLLRHRGQDRADAALAFGRPWRQAEGLLGSLMVLLGLDLPAPDRTTSSKHQLAD